MWIRPDRVVRARMPSLREQPPSAPRAPAPAARPAAPAPAARKAPSAPEPERDVDDLRDGGFHESSYELRTGMDMLETEWPEDTTIPGGLDEL